MAVDPAPVRRRLFITGRSGSGKSTLAQAIGRRTGLTVHDLDQIARVGGGRGTETSAAARADAVAAILASGEWVAEGVHLTWTGPLLDAADAIVWLDHVGGRQSGGNVIRRFISGALAEARRRRGRERLLRFRDYGRRLRELFVSLPDTRSFSGPEVERLTSTYSGKLVRCRSEADVERFISSLPTTSG